MPRPYNKEDGARFVEIAKELGASGDYKVTNQLHVHATCSLYLFMYMYMYMYIYNVVVYLEGGAHRDFPPPNINWSLLKFLRCT